MWSRVIRKLRRWTTRDINSSWNLSGIWKLWRRPCARNVENRWVVKCPTATWRKWYCLCVRRLNRNKYFFILEKLWPCIYLFVHAVTKLLFLLHKISLIQLHSVSKETHHKFIGFTCDPGSRSGDPSRVIFYHANLKQVAKNPIQKCQMVLPISWKVQEYVVFWNS